ncbi:MAG TPA: hypothetical protein VMV90_09885 [Rectinemataceae bacterium]|nr:hypothetical protein [Rectinemataceae bacterium]
MKRLALIAIVLVLLAAPAFAQFRLDVGIIVPRGLGTTSGATSEGSFVSDWPFIPLPEAGLYYQGDLGLVKLGIGARAFSFILETILWPNAYAELDFGRFAVQAQFGGGAFAMFGLANSTSTGNVFIPDLSAWFKLGKERNLRLGGGIVGLDVPSVFGSDMPFLLYFGGKLSVIL